MKTPVACATARPMGREKLSDTGFDTRPPVKLPETISIDYVPFFGSSLALKTQYSMCNIIKRSRACLSRLKSLPLASQGPNTSRTKGPACLSPLYLEAGVNRHLPGERTDENRERGRPSPRAQQHTAAVSKNENETVSLAETLRW